MVATYIEVVGQIEVLSEVEVFFNEVLGEIYVIVFLCRVKVWYEDLAQDNVCEVEVLYEVLSEIEFVVRLEF